ncbi:cation-translocating P-type ATPase [Pelosinus sp. UFO1]|uniref:heavy metal translocating P-type ATPase n=1 Tax=Pelosinus sp. UFO1 TaxID=484770 RepID=UPI0004D1C3DC|nr:cation-translocating P-type ATPase [Pelosinus sp. UFO1]AIF52147.1 heavy metal translocating P-type ATPase [Pelosinus sp. UFO1]
MATTSPQIVHQIPGRIRVYHPRIKYNPNLAAQIEMLLREQKGIEECKANPKSGKILIKYNRDMISEEVLWPLLQNQSYNTSKPKVCKREKTKPFELEDVSIPTQIALVAIGGLALLYHLFRYLFRPAPLSLNLARQTSLITLITAFPILRSGVENLFLRRVLNNEILIGTAIILSVLLREGTTGLVVVWLVNLSTLIETLTLDKSRRTIRSMLEGNQKDAWLVINGQEILVPISQLKENDTVSVKLGSKIPVDGIIVNGEAVVNQAALTGEPVPVHKQIGDMVLAGSTIEQGTLYIKAERVGDKTSVARVIHLVEQATHSKAPIQKMADTYSARLIPASFILAFVVFLLTGDIRRTMTILIVACPCAAGLATPTALSAAIGNAASRGILVKGGRYLEEAGKIDFLLFDKTGTLTEGKSAVTKVISLHNGYDSNSILTLAAAAEANANHPLANAIKEAAENQGIVLPCVPDSEMTIGRGVKATIEGVVVYVGNSLYLNQMGIKTPLHFPFETKDIAESATLVYIARGTTLIGVIVITDCLRPNAESAIRSIREEGIPDIGIVSGDTDTGVTEIASRLKLEKIWPNMLPQDKFNLIKSLQEQGHVVGMVGDGINDSPSLALANVGIAMGVGGADAAIETAGIVLREDNPEKIVEIIRLGKKSLVIIRQNFVFAIGANIIGLGLGSAKLISPFLAAVLHNASTLAVVLNSTRLLTYAPHHLTIENELSQTSNKRYELSYQEESLTQKF